MEEERQFEIRQSESDDFLILEDGDFPRKKSDSKTVCIKNPIIVVQNSINVVFMQKLWMALLTLHIFLIPAIVGLMIGEMMMYADVLSESSGNQAGDWNIHTGVNLTCNFSRDAEEIMQTLKNNTLIDTTFIEIKHHIVMVCFAVSTFIGVPFHLLAMEDLEEALHQAELSVLSRDEAIQTDVVEDDESGFETYDNEID